MQVTAPRDALLAAIKVVGAAVAARTTQPILACVKLSAAGDRLTLSGTDTEVGVRYDLPGVTVTRPGDAVLNPARLAAILAESRDTDITISVGDDTATVRTSSGRFDLPSGNPSEFPEIPAFDGDAADYHEVAAGVLRTMLKRTVFAAEKRESTRYAVTGVLWGCDAAGVCRLVATDTRRLAACEGPAVVVGGGTDTAKAGAIVPTKAIGILERLLGDDGELVKVTLRPTGALFQTERATLHTKLVEGKFPPYQSLLNSVKATTRITLTVGAFLTAVRQAATMADDDTRRVSFAFDPAVECVTLTAQGPRTGSGVVTLPLPGYAGPATRIDFDPAFLTDFLRAVDPAATVALEMTDGNKPAVFRLEGEPYRYLVMPLSAK